MPAHVFVLLYPESRLEFLGSSPEIVCGQFYGGPKWSYAKIRKALIRSKQNKTAKRRFEKVEKAVCAVKYSCVR